MKKILATAIVLVSSVLGVALVSACAAPAEVDEHDIARKAALQGPGIWQLNRECGTNETGTCNGDIVGCGADTIGAACPDAGARCLTAPNESGLRQVLFCNPTSSSTWTYNGDCANKDCGNRPACDGNDDPGKRCHYPLKRCGKHGRVLVCLTDGKTQYVFGGYCGENGGPACAGFADCPQDEDGMAGLACGDVGAACRRKTGKLTGKVFTCVSR
jgi:hypothetical protein